MRRWRTTEHENGRPWLQVFYFQHGPGSFHSSAILRLPRQHHFATYPSLFYSVA
jgi:hypothetical protein